MSTSEFHVVDVFAAAAWRGNPVMVVRPQRECDSASMQAFASWNGMPETVFLSTAGGRPDGEPCYAARIFSPRAELRFAGHPSLGAAHVAMQTGLVGLHFVAEPKTTLSPARETARIWQRCGAGDVLVHVHRMATGVEVFVRTPAPASSAALAQEQCAAVAHALRCADVRPAYRVSAGAEWIILKLPDAAALSKLQPDMASVELLSRELEVSGITAYAPAPGPGPARFEVRSFGPAIGVPEDAVCGGGNACVAALQSGLDGLTPADPVSYSTQQGRFVGRDGTVQLRGPVEDGRFWIGGATRVVMSGRVQL